MKKTTIRKICDTVINSSLYHAIPLLLIILTASVTQVFADLAYVVNATGTVSVINTSTNTVTATIGVDVGAQGIAITPATPNGAFAYVTSPGSNNVKVIDTTFGSVTTTISGIIAPYAIAITPNGKFAYVTSNSGGNVYVIDTSTNTVVTGSGYPISVGANPQAIAASPDGGFVYVANLADGTVSVINTLSNTVTATIHVGSNPQGIAVSPTTGLAYVTNANSTNASVISTTANLHTITLLNLSVPFGIAIPPNGDFAYVTNAGLASVSVIDTSSNMVVGSPISVGTDPLAIAITSDGKFAYVVNNINHNVSVIDTSTNMVVVDPGVIPIIVGSNPQSIAITPGVSPPQNLTGSQKKNDFGLVYERFNLLKWDASTSNAVVGYFVYRNGIKIATLNASTLKYEDHNIQKGVTTAYSVTSFDALGNESVSSNITIN